VKDANGKEDSASYQKAPKTLCKTSEDVSKPSKATQEGNKSTHYDSFTKMPSTFIEPLRSLIC